MIHISNARKSFGDLCVFENLNLNINNPGLFILKGESGSGKSTLLNLLAGYDVFDEGLVNIDDNIATIFQNYELIQELNVFDNILLTKENLDKNEEEILQLLELDELLNHYPNELSGGQKQRVGIARALILNPNIILCDEPTESLDIDNKHIVMNLLRKLAKDKIVLVATHDEKMIESYADRIYVINNKTIEINEIHSIDTFFQKKDKYDLDNEKLKVLIHKILYKSTKKASIIILALIMIIQQLFIYNQKMFYIPETTNVVNANILYIEAFRNGINPSHIGLTKEDIQPIIPFYSIMINNTYESFEIYPYEETDLHIDGIQPGKNEVVINQNLANYLGEWENETITAEYSFSNTKGKIEFKIVGVVEEKDSNRYSIYYNLESIIDDFDMETIEVYEENKHKLLSYTEYLGLYGTMYKANISYERMNEYYKYAEKRYELSVNNPLYDQRNDMKEESIIFQIMFYSFEVILLLGLILYIILYIRKDTNRYLSVCAILVSSQIPIKQIMQFYLAEKIKYITLYFVESELVFILFNYLLGNFNALNLHSIITLLVALIIVSLVYLTSIIINLKQLKMNKISNILKDEKDN